MHKSAVDWTQRSIQRGYSERMGMGNHNISKFHACNKVLVKSCVHFYHQIWKKRCVVLNNPEVQKKVLKEEVEVIVEEANREEI